MSMGCDYSMFVDVVPGTFMQDVLHKDDNRKRRLVTTVFLAWMCRRVVGIACSDTTRRS